MVVLNKSKASVTENNREDWGRPAESVSPSLRPFAHQGPSAGGGESLALRGGRSARPSIPMLAGLAQREKPLSGVGLCCPVHTLCVRAPLCQGSFGCRRQWPFCGSSSEALVLLGAAVDAKFQSVASPVSDQGATNRCQLSRAPLRRCPSQCVENLLFWQREVFGKQGKLRTTLLEMRMGHSDLKNV